MEELRVQRRQLEVQNATDIINVFCQERLRNQAQMCAIHMHFEVSL